MIVKQEENLSIKFWLDEKYNFNNRSQISEIVFDIELHILERFEKFGEKFSFEDFSNLKVLKCDEYRFLFLLKNGLENFPRSLKKIIISDVYYKDYIKSELEIERDKSLKEIFNQYYLSSEVYSKDESGSTVLKRQIIFNIDKWRVDYRRESNSMDFIKRRSDMIFNLFIENNLKKEIVFQEEISGYLDKNSELAKDRESLLDYNKLLIGEIKDLNYHITQLE
jgi:hypothetical protein